MRVEKYWTVKIKLPEKDFGEYQIVNDDDYGIVQLTEKGIQHWCHGLDSYLVEWELLKREFVDE